MHGCVGGRGGEKPRMRTWNVGRDRESEKGGPGKELGTEVEGRQDLGLAGNK